MKRGRERERENVFVVVCCTGHRLSLCVGSLGALCRRLGMLRPCRRRPPPTTTTPPFYPPLPPSQVMEQLINDGGGVGRERERERYIPTILCGLGRLLTVAFYGSVAGVRSPIRSVWAAPHGTLKEDVKRRYRVHILQISCIYYLLAES